MVSARRNWAASVRRPWKQLGVAPVPHWIKYLLFAAKAANSQWIKYLLFWASLLSTVGSHWDGCSSRPSQAHIGRLARWLFVRAAGLWWKEAWMPLLAAAGTAAAAGSPDASQRFAHMQDRRPPERLPLVRLAPREDGEKQHNCALELFLAMPLPEASTTPQAPWFGLV